MATPIHADWKHATVLEYAALDAIRSSEPVVIVPVLPDVPVSRWGQEISASVEIIETRRFRRVSLNGVEVWQREA